MLSNISLSHEVVSVGPVDLHTRYTVMLDFEGNTYTVHRRFTDFCKLRKELLFQVKGAVIPPLPRRRMVNRFDLNIIESRKRGLVEFLAGVGRSEELCQYPLLITFIMDPSIENFALVCEGLHEAVRQAPYNDMSSWFTRNMQQFYSSQQVVAIPPYILETDVRLQEVETYISRQANLLKLEEAARSLLECRQGCAQECALWGALVVGMSDGDDSLGGMSLRIVGESTPLIISQKYMCKPDGQGVLSSVAPPTAAFPSALTLLHETTERLVDSCDAISEAWLAQQEERKRYVYALHDFEKRLRNMMDSSEELNSPPTEEAEQRLGKSKEAMGVIASEHKAASDRVQRDFKVVVGVERQQLLRCICALAEWEAAACHDRVVAWENVSERLQVAQASQIHLDSVSVLDSTHSTTSNRYHELVSTYFVTTDDGDSVLTRITI